MLELVKELCALNGVSGAEEEVRDFIRAKAAPYADSTFDYFGKDAENKTIRKDAEIDFYAKKGTRRLYIQVCADLSSPSTREREIRPFLALDDSVQKVLVLARPAKAALDENGFLVIGAPEFLLRFLREEY